MHDEIELRTESLECGFVESQARARQVAEDAREQDWKLPSFGKGLFMGDFQLELIHPQPGIDPALAPPELLAALPAGHAAVTRPTQSSRTERVWCETPRWRSRGSACEIRAARIDVAPPVKTCALNWSGCERSW